HVDELDRGRRLRGPGNPRVKTELLWLPLERWRWLEHNPRVSRLRLGRHVLFGRAVLELWLDRSIIGLAAGLHRRRMMRGRLVGLRTGARPILSRSILAHRSTPDRGSYVGAPEDLRAQHPNQVNKHEVEPHRLRRRLPPPNRPTTGVVAVITAHEHDRRRHRHRLDHAVQEVQWVLVLPEDQQIPTRGHRRDLTHDRDVRGEKGRAERDDVDERQHDPRREQTCRAQKRHRVDAHHLERVDLLTDTHRAELRHDARADLRGHDVAEY